MSVAGAKMKEDKDETFLNVLMHLDEKVSLALSLSASKDSPLGSLRPYMKGLEYSCHGIFWIPICCICLWFSYDPVKVTFFFNFLVALFLDILIITILKASINRTRPSNNESEDMFLTVSVDKMSCPSGHTSRAVLIMFLLISLSPDLVLLHPFLIIWGLATCMSRVLLGRHYLGDVLIGMAVGYFEYCIMNYIWASPETAKWYMDFFSDTESIVDGL